MATMNTPSQTPIVVVEDPSKRKQVELIRTNIRE